MKGPFGNKVIWNTKRQEYLCTECANSIHDTINENEFMDNEEGWDKNSTFKSDYSTGNQ